MPQGKAEGSHWEPVQLYFILDYSYLMWEPTKSLNQHTISRTVRDSGPEIPAGEVYSAFVIQGY